MDASSPKLVCLTGAAGYIGSHVCRELLARGHRVRATVRDPADASKTSHLRALPGADRLDLVRADLMEPGSFDAPVKGCDWVCHVAAAVTLNASDPQREIVDPAVEGTRNVLGAVERAGSVSCVGMTSSIAAIGATERKTGHTYTEDDWNEDATLGSNPYGLGKTLSERLAWSHHESMHGPRRYALTIVNPSLVIGPLHARAHVRSSPSAVRSLARGELMGCPPLGFGLVDVRDVATALVNGLERAVTGRHILTARSLWMREIAEIIARAFPDRRVPTRRLPGFVLYIAALFDKRVSFAYLRRNLHRLDPYANDRAQRSLGVTFRPVEESIVGTCRSLAEHGLL